MIVTGSTPAPRGVRMPSLPSRPEVTTTTALAGLALCANSTVLGAQVRGVYSGPRVGSPSSAVH